MRPAVIVPFHDPAWLANVAANLGRQTFKTDVVIAVNGRAADIDLDYPVVLSGESHAAAVNAGAAWCRAYGYTHGICLDSDDYYGGGYVAQALKALGVGDFIGKRSVYTWLSNGLHRFKRPHFMGGTIGFAIDKFQPMCPVLQDDHDWFERMSDAHALGIDTGPSEYCYVRHGNNAHWQANDVLVRRAMGEGEYYPEASIESVVGDPGHFTVVPAPTDAEVFEAM